jgi:ubiquinone/menaquinone biosynthesis C-methylase UbiE
VEQSNFLRNSAVQDHRFHSEALCGIMDLARESTVDVIPQQSAPAVGIEYGQAFRNVRSLLSVFAELGKPIKRDDAVLDFGCGEGKMVYAFRKLGYRAFGTDLAPSSGEAERLIEAEGLCMRGEKPLTLIQAGAYKIPFDNEYFDFLVSWDVMEHVQCHTEAFLEINRVLKRGGRSLHFFPSRYSILEPHIGVPFGTIIQAYCYLYLWAVLGLRDESQAGCTVGEIARKNYEFLKTETKYLSKRHLVKLAASSFREIRFVEKYFWKHTCGKGQFIYETLSRLGLVKVVPLATALLSPFGYRALFFVKP